MSTKTYIITALFSLLVSVVARIGTEFWLAMIIEVSGLFLFTFACILAIVKVGRYLFSKNDKNPLVVILLLVLTLIIILTLGVLYFFILSPQPVPSTTKPAHFRTNILTGDCEYGGYSTHSTPSPWYYSMGCDVDDSQRRDVFVESDIYDDFVEACHSRCDRGDWLRFCVEGSIYLVDSFTCEGHVSCEGIDCREYDELLE